MSAQTSVLANELTVMTWNVQVGHDGGVLKNNWTVRKSLVLKQILDAKADIYCLQEVSPDQKTYITQKLKAYSAFGVGRDDGRYKGEHCLILYKNKVFELKSGDTFWLSDTPSMSKNTWDYPFKRICTWTRFREKESNKNLFVFNTHFPLNPLVQTKAAELIKEKIEKVLEVDKKSSVIICGDFNCDEKSNAWKVFQNAGFKPVSTAKSITIMGKPIACTDTVFINGNIKVIESKTNLLRNESGRCASDHFSITAKFDL